MAPGLVSEADVASPLRQMVGNAPNIQILLGEVVDIDPKARSVLLKSLLKNARALPNWSNQNPRDRHFSRDWSNP